MEAVTWSALGLVSAFALGTLFYLGARIDALAARMDSRFDRMDARFDSMIARIDLHLDRHPF